jgi:Holliday junction resolvasome RuvABC ATP-dependent DNA helicase subunit
MPAKEKVDPRIQALYKEAIELVGIDGPRDELINWLKEKEDESLRFVSIVGYGGLGKTTLAKQIQANLKFEAGTTLANLGAGVFECGAFVSISRKPDMKAILKSIFSEISKQKYSGLDDIKTIMDKIREFLQNRRYVCYVISTAN